MTELEQAMIALLGERKTNSLMEIPIKEKGLINAINPQPEPDLKEPELFSLQEDPLQESEASSPIDGVTNRDPIQAGHERMTLNFSKCNSGEEGSTVYITYGTTASEGGRNTFTNSKETPSPKMTPEEMTVTNTYSQSGKPATAQPRAGVKPEREPDGGRTLYHSPHKVRRTGNRIEIHSPEPLPPDQHPRDFDELLIFLDDCAITVKSTADGLLFSGGTEVERERAVACLSGCVWTEGNLRRYLDGTLRDIDGRKYRYPKRSA